MLEHFKTVNFKKLNINFYFLASLTAAMQHFQYYCIRNTFSDCILTHVIIQKQSNIPSTVLPKTLTCAGATSTPSLVRHFHQSLHFAHLCPGHLLILIYKPKGNFRVHKQAKYRYHFCRFGY